MEEIKFKNLTLVNHGSYYSVRSCDKDATSVTIPVEINGCLVIGIEEKAFDSCTSLTSVTFEEPSNESREFLYADYYEIGENAFINCTALERIDLPAYVSSIGHGAFYGCTKLRTVSHHSPYISPYSFVHCSGLTEITPVDYASEGSFSGCASLTKLPLSSKVTEIAESCFELCEGLTEITVSSQVDRIEPLAFRGCRSLKKVVFEDLYGWRAGNVYTGEEFDLDVSDPVENAKLLSRMDFDDGWMPIIKTKA